jgi:hypothetical protein
VPGLAFVDSSSVVWSEPLDPGGTMPFHDTLRSSDPADYTAGTRCVESSGGSDLEATDLAVPAPGGVYNYLVRAKNDCPEGTGTLGHDSNGTERLGRSCP